MRDGYDGDFAAFEDDLAVAEGEEGVVAAAADVETGGERRAALADEDRAGGDRLTVEAFDAEELGIAVATVACGALSLFMCHVKKPLVAIVQFVVPTRHGG